ncbi:hypothetical protein METBIDRAFT_198579 [Metschnikowia bicuspidata var. bicuspidata NRRL YB-4993]|uniref:Uncharacterized protein n=1 Tax=Metschnikowia bicuspidata var. bicuspidata NRRL YB-4993 TaxID=869754 RepID=A0A1A0H8H2_9ASCO|nr:hypothetical protein METBIDRAFT_198579 [Metschnikowia bicuspidata var. bicuspidata NRRL YB-4993]OBA20414.1 hypothetical protein METBIDRAFT_198579 [Metschnikowia bicuspidata var. bicuspidata NRRL YB-4993]
MHNIAALPLIIYCIFKNNKQTDDIRKENKSINETAKSHNRLHATVIFLQLCRPRDRNLASHREKMPDNTTSQSEPPK